MAGDGLEGLSAEELAILGHEVRSPVAALSNLSEVAARFDATGSDPESARERAEALRAIVKLARAAVDDVVRLCGPAEADSVTIGALTRVSLPDLLRGVTLGALDGERSADVHTNFSAHPGRTEIECDPTRLRQALSNIVANGVRHGEKVEVDARGVGDDVVIEITDDGPGVPEGIDVFAKGVSGAGSSGYGLWVARSIVEAHGGTIELVRDDEPGACFRIVLPLASASA